VARIKAYTSKMRQPRSFEDGAEILRELFAAQFPKLTDEQWLGAARRTWKPQDRKLVLTSSTPYPRCGINSTRSRASRSW
jgi:hypothetical protein